MSTTKLTKQHLSTKIFKSYFIYIRENHPHINLQKTCEECGLSIEYIEDENNWVSVIFARDFMKRIIAASNEDNLAYVVGTLSLTRKYLGDLFYFFFRYSFSTEKVYRLLASLSKHFNKVMQMEVLASERNKIKIKFYPIEVEKLNEEEKQALTDNLVPIYENTVGYLSGIPRIFSKPAAKTEYQIKEEKGFKSLYVDLTYQASSSKLKWISFFVFFFSCGLFIWLQAPDRLVLNDLLTKLTFLGIPSFLLLSLYLLFRVWQYRRLMVSTDQTIKKLDEQYRDLQNSKEELEHSFKKLQEMDKLKDEFLANTSHELRTPLNGIIGIGESLLDGVAGKLNDICRQNINMVVASSKRLASLISDILDFSKLKEKGISIKPESLDIKEVASEMIAFCRVLVKRKDLQMINECPENLFVKADKNRLLQIFTNLINNAIKFTHQGQIIVKATLQDSFVCVSVQDSGIGISPANQKKIFKPFEQADGSISRSYGGTGLGLAITNKLVQLHGGTLELESEEGKGSTFAFTLPMAKKVNKENIEPIEKEENYASIQPEVLDIAKNQLKPPTGSDLIMVVDDEPVNCQVLHNFLTLNNYQVLLLESGAKALDYLEKNSPPQLILLDVMMPEMSGLEVCKKIRERYQENELPIIMLTAKNQTNDMVQGFQLGANDYVYKPFVKDELLARIHSQLDLLKLNRSLKEKAKLERDLEAAKIVQDSFFPPPTTIPNLDIIVDCKMADVTGGDWYYYYYDEQQELLDIILGDVTGHGIPAALVTGVAFGSVLTSEDQLIKAKASNERLKQIFLSLDKSIKCAKDKYMSTCMLSLDLRKGELNYINAGHLPVYWYSKKDDKLQTIYSRSYQLGEKKKQSDFICKSVQLSPGDCLLLYSDGIVENVAPGQKPFNMISIKNLVSQEIQLKDFHSAVSNKVAVHMGDQSLKDDATLIMMQWGESSSN